MTCVSGVILCNILNPCLERKIMGKENILGVCHFSLSSKRELKRHINVFCVFTGERECDAATLMWQLRPPLHHPLSSLCLRSIGAVRWETGYKTSFISFLASLLLSSSPSLSQPLNATLGIEWVLLLEAPNAVYAMVALSRALLSLALVASCLCLCLCSPAPTNDGKVTPSNNVPTSQCGSFFLFPLLGFSPLFRAFFLQSWNLLAEHPHSISLFLDLSCYAFGANCCLGKS